MGESAERFFVDLVTNRIIQQPYQLDAFSSFFEDNWLPRKYGKETARLIDKIFKIAFKADRGITGRNSFDETMMI